MVLKLTEFKETEEWTQRSGRVFRLLLENYSADITGTKKNSDTNDRPASVRL